MNMTTKVVLCLSLLSAASLSALSSQEKQFIKAVRAKDVQVINSLLNATMSQKAWDKALYLAAHEQELALFSTLVSSIKYNASQKGYKRAQRSFDRQLRDAARNTDVRLYNELFGYASRKGQRKAAQSLNKRLNK